MVEVIAFSSMYNFFIDNYENSIDYDVDYGHINEILLDIQQKYLTQLKENLIKLYCFCDDYQIIYFEQCIHSLKYDDDEMFVKNNDMVNDDNMGLARFIHEILNAKYNDVFLIKDSIIQTNINMKNKKYYF